MQKIVLVLFTILLSGCSLNTLFMQGEIDKVTVVKYTPYMKHHRAFLSRDHLKVIKNGGKYLYLYHQKNNDLAILLHRNKQYVLYNLSDPKQKALPLKTKRNNKYTYALKSFKRLGYRTISSPATKGFIVSVSHQRYKGVKTLLVEAKEYTRLLSLYKKAIRTYDASNIKNIKTKLPKVLISDYYMRYKKRASGHKQLTQLRIIAKKLELKGPALPKNPHAETVEEPEDKIAWYESKKKEAHKISAKEASIKLYQYHLKDAGLGELSLYLSKETTQGVLSHSQYNKLKQREKSLQEKKLISEGSLDELISAYKVNKKPKYKERIMSLMKEKQEHKKINLSPLEE
ncbi:MAG: hypothetical protein COA92_06235 [Sulfurovum sp.]|nr:MAG: hypothetical protein COA92_06235 [Sulfurovum sp.]